MSKDKIKELALKAGFKLKEQVDESMDLNPYVYDFAYALIDSVSNKIKAEAVRQCIVVMDEIESPEVSDFLDYADKLERGEHKPGMRPAVLY